MERAAKRPCLVGDVEEAETEARPDGLYSLSRAISPPKKRNRQGELIRSPFQLTRIRDLPEAANHDTVALKGILGDPLIAECWEFNFLHDIHFLMSHFDEDTRDLVKVHVVHGFWKREDPNRLALQEEAEAYPNVELHGAFMPEMFGTHHSKMMILIRHDDSAQVIIHTANMIAKDWTNMTNAVWRSPILPLLPDDHVDDASTNDHSFGTGKQFKHDILSYLRAYNTRRPTVRTLVDQLRNYDFSDVRATLIASVPGRHPIHDTSQTAWGWPALKRALRSVPVQEGKSEVVVQISSIATLGASDSWIQKCLFDSLAVSKNNSLSTPRPKFKVVFPTADEIRRSLDGYASGGSIHTKIQSQQQAKQLQYLRPIFHHWANDAPEGEPLPETAAIQEAGRKRAAPHIKTYIRYGDKSIDWALVTSANISKQAWGEAAGASQEVRIASWEIGVLVWPSAITDKATMVGTFETDMPSKDVGDGDPVVGMRIPYNLPLQAYGKDEIPWVASMVHTDPDRMGRLWGVE
ncbi:putative U3 small nucleolar RNA-associated protein 13 [Colletotrichum spaethianum]|uniref:U3 small nucleolar RNA-associated protein 13 n=1 Tax=Colletotrichum spaethianum TaxID=700344 RepID=A0AA37P7T7_9PEZI|nr:putative U3 small nucleolar RNA-associated protein 13 [Colletotrichum spaethianum]GKT45619.1 putative U3 small nucleolar RNA-associated protein 13 [Colletotrichum spaethianum]